MTRINDYDEFGADQSHDYRSFQEFIRCSYVNVNTDLTGAAYQNYFEKLRISGSHGNETEESAANILDAYKHLLRAQIRAYFSYMKCCKRA